MSCVPPCPEGSALVNKRLSWISIFFSNGVFIWLFSGNFEEYIAYGNIPELRALFHKLRYKNNLSIKQAIYFQLSLIEFDLEISCNLLK